MKTTHSGGVREERLVNRIPPSTTKRRGSSRKSSGGSSRKSADGSSSEGRHVVKKRRKSETSGGDVFEKLDPSDPVHANRMQQRRKAISKGKNTAGYDCYLQQVPKEARQERSMETPSTPDPTLDISSKRWQGQMRAW